MKRILFAIIVAAGLGCENSAPTGPAVVTRYELVRLNGLPLPYLQSESGSSKQEVLNGEIRLFADGSYNDRMRFRSTQGSFSSTFDVILRGPFVREGSTITFTVISEEDPSGNDKYSGTFNQDTLTIQAASAVWKYVER
jgi:hypothetical protein